MENSTSSKIAEIINACSPSDYDKALQELKEIFADYRMDRKRCPDSETVKFAQHLITKHAERCKNADAVTRRQHNEFVAYYTGSQKIRNIAIANNVHSRTVSRDIEACFERLMVMVFGVDGVKWHNV